MKRSSEIVPRFLFVAMSRPFRAETNHTLFPTALPWAGMCRPFGACGAVASGVENSARTLAGFWSNGADGAGLSDELNEMRISRHPQWLYSNLVDFSSNVDLYLDA